MFYFWKLLLAHFLADYPLQPDALVRRKGSSSALLAHLTVQFVIMVILLWPLSGGTVVVILGVTAFHGLLDPLKPLAVRRLVISQRKAYFLDQALHILSLALAAWIIVNLSPQVREVRVEAWIIQALAFVLSTFVWGITERVLAEPNPAWLAEVRAQYGSRLALRALPVIGLTVAYYIGPPTWLLAGFILPYLGMRYWRRALLADVLIMLGACTFILAFT